MLRRREKLFRCDFEGTSMHVYAHVLAWDAPEAMTLFRAELLGDGVEGPGTIAVTRIGRSSPSATATWRAAARERHARGSRS